MQTNRVLCVEDDTDTRDMLKKMLNMSDFEAVVAPDVYSALQMMERKRFSLYVLDDGLQYLQYSINEPYISLIGYKLYLTYMFIWHKVVENRVRLLFSQLLWNLPVHLKSTAKPRRS